MSSYVPPSAPPESSMTREQVVSEAGSFAQARFQEVRQGVTDGNCSLRVMALLGALALLVVSVLGFLADVLSLRWISAIFDVYVFFLGIVIILIEYGRSFRWFANYEDCVYRHALFLKYVWGRGILYFFTGTLAMACQGLSDLIAGGFMCFVGILFILVGRSASSKLRNVQQTCTAEQLQEQFAIADVDGVGSLNMKQFYGLTNALNMGLTKREVESAFLQLDVDRDGRVRYETVAHWWSNGTAQLDFIHPIVM